MKLVIPMVELLDALDDYESAVLNGALLRVYQSNTTPTLASNAASFTESSFAGYAAVALSSWGAAFDNGSSEAEIDHPAVTFTCTGGAAENIYGVYVTSGGVLLYAQRLDTPPAPFVISNGLSFTYTPKYLMKNIT